MTAQERTNPHLIDISRRRRIASGAGVEPADISSLVKQFDAMAAVVKQMSEMSMMDKVKMMMGFGKGDWFNPKPPQPPPRKRHGNRPDSGDRDDDGASPVPRG